jgi:hypothetical protein
MLYQEAIYALGLDLPAKAAGRFEQEARHALPLLACQVRKGIGGSNASDPSANHGDALWGGHG